MFCTSSPLPSFHRLHCVDFSIWINSQVNLRHSLYVYHIQIEAQHSSSSSEGEKKDQTQDVFYSEDKKPRETLGAFMPFKWLQSPSFTHTQNVYVMLLLIQYSSGILKPKKNLRQKGTRSLQLLRYSGWKFASWSNFFSTYIFLYFTFSRHLTLLYGFNAIYSVLYINVCVCVWFRIK